MSKILKISDDTTRHRGWMFFTNVKKFDVNNSYVLKYDKNQNFFLCEKKEDGVINENSLFAFDSSKDFMNLDWSEIHEGLKSGEAYSVKIISIDNNDEKVSVVCFRSVNAFLLNDEGNTIDKL